MRVRNRVLVGASVLGLVALSVLWKVMYDRHKLSVYRDYIEARYAAQLAVIERNCLVSPRGDLSEADCFRLAKLTSATEASLSANEIWSASWSSDGHHGLESLKPLETGFTTYRLYGAHSADRTHSLYFGKTFDNRPLLVYEGWVEGGGKRQYTLAFLLDGIESMPGK
jgi:hypothetical protein